MSCGGFCEAGTCVAVCDCMGGMFARNYFHHFVCGFVHVRFTYVWSNMLEICK